MFDPTKLGEEADSMIAALNQPQGEQPAPENQQGENTEAIAQTPETPVDDKGVEAQPTPPDISSQLAELKKQAESADQRWRVLQGMIDKKDEEINSLRVLLSQLSAKPEQSAAEQKPSQLITQTDISEYGTDLIDLIGRKASEVYQNKISTLEAHLAELRNQLSNVAQTTVKSAQERFADALTTKVPDWESLNVDPNFITWLNQPAPFTKETKLSLLRRASSELDANEAAEFFLEYKKEQTPAQPTAQNPDPNKLVAPGRSKAPATKVDNAGSGRIWTRADIGKLYDDKMAGRISQKEFDELERDVFKAQRENRIAA
jgi:hypothetical protein